MQQSHPMLKMMIPSKKEENQQKRKDMARSKKCLSKVITAIDDILVGYRIFYRLSSQLEAGFRFNL